MSVTSALWADLAVDRLLDSVSCPVCGARALHARRCAACGSDFSGPVGAELWSASQEAATALRHRQDVLARVPQVVADKRMPAAAVPPAASAPQPSRQAQGPSATVQSVLAIAGAGLVAVAAVVFTFFNPDLTDTTARSLIVAAVTLVFLAGARLLGRRGLQFSAEAVGALGMVFLALDVYAVTDAVPGSPWIPAAFGTLVAGTAMAALGVRWRIRVWLWLSLLALASVPAMLAAASSTRLATVLGWLATGFAALVLIEAAGALGRRFGRTLTAERVALTIVELLAVGVAVVSVLGVEIAAPPLRWAFTAAVLAAIAGLALLATRRLLPGVWSTIAGLAGACAVVALAQAPYEAVGETNLWLLFVTPAAAAAGALVLGCLLPLPRAADRRFVLGGAVAVALAAAAMPLQVSLFIGASTLLIEDLGVNADSFGPVVLGLAAVAAGLIGIRALGGRLRLRLGWIGALGGWFATASALTLVCAPALSPAGRVALGVTLVIAASAAIAWLPPVRATSAAARLPVIVGAHLALVLCAAMSWRDSDLVVAGGVAVVVAIAFLGRAMPAAARFLYTGLAYAYALLVFAAGLGLAGVAAVAVLCLTTSLGALGTIAATYLPRVGARSWWAILAVTAVPFVLGVAQVVVERSGWTALSTGVIFLLALALVLTRRPGLGTALRALAATLLVPSLAVVVVCLGAQLLVSSGSPVVLPVIAAIVALVLPSTGLIRTALERRGLGQRDAAATRLAIEASSLLTAGIAVALGLAREAAGLGTTCLVLVVLGAGALATAVWGGRRYGWWVAGAAFTGALWCVWGLTGVGIVEPYLLPPALAAAVIGAVLTARSRGGSAAVPLYAAGLALAVVPMLVLLAAVGTPADSGGGTAWRAFGLLGASWALLAAGGVFGRVPRLRPLRLPTLAAAIAAGAAGAVQGVRLGVGLDAAAGTGPLIAVCAALSFLGAVPAFAAARGIHLSASPGSRLRRTRWLTAPAMLYLAAGTWPAIERDWFAIWAMWGLMLCFLIAVAAVAWRLRTHRTSLPPVWFVFAIAFVTAIVAWSPRDLRVEWFSLPLGAFLLIAGALHLRVTPRARGMLDSGPTVNSWPAGFRGSWALLAPGLVVLLSASMTATFTDPLTWRAILVMALALAAILVGASRRLAAPFLIGIVALPVENALVFAVQLGRGIASMPWWITLAVVGAVLLIIAVTYERRAAGEGGFVARLRDLG
ncbi:MAG TPA: hypothetical protein VFN24_12595 [Microbacterium sp.]|nr:hypothetical protein [Microbacterium sp.]